MTLDEAIEYYINGATQRAIADEEMGVNDNSRWYETKFMTKKESEQIIADNRQLAEWLRELKEAKRMLKLAIEDMYYALSGEDEICKSCICDHNCYNKDEYECIRYGCDVCAKWRYADEALKLIEGNAGNDDERVNNLYKEAEKISNNAGDTKEEG